MGFYIRKSISAGPFRFNLSTSGLGISAGVKGFRVGTGPRGNYVHMGRGGLYYRASLGPGTPRQSNAPSPHSQPSPEPETSGLAEVEAGNIMQMAPAKAEDILSQINSKM